MLRLGEEERAAIALKILDSISAPDTRDEAEWVREIEQRARRALSGSHENASFDDALDQIDRDLDL
ncbi:MAG: addiction module protein [Pseudomonadota bacterium]